MKREKMNGLLFSHKDITPPSYVITIKVFFGDTYFCRFVDGTPDFSPRLSQAKRFSSYEDANSFRKSLGIFARESRVVEISIK